MLSSLSMSALPNPLPQLCRPASRFVPAPVAWAAAILLQAAPAWAQGADALPALQLKRSPMLAEEIDPVYRSQQPSFVSADRLGGRTNLETTLEGNAELRRGDMVVRADRIEYYQPDDQVTARGNIRINKAGNVYEGPELQLKVETFEGFFLQPRYQLLRNQAHGEASRIDFLDEQRSIISDATYTTCLREPGPDWMPDWILRASRISLDAEEEVGRAEGAVLSFKGVPILPVPSISFPMSDKRKSGVLPPTIGLDSVNGLDLTLPYYWNIAPNRDATIYPTVMSRRGVNLGGEFRYLETDYRGTLRLDWMPNDRLRDRDRWGFAATQLGNFRLSSGAELTTNLNLNRVSDDNYWRDFSRSSSSLTQRLLANDVNVAWRLGDFSANLRTLKWQTLQDVTSPITPPYDKLPQLTGHWGQSDLRGFDVSLTGDFTRFQADRTLTGQPNADRAYTLAQISRPWVFPSGFITPKLQLHATSYNFDVAPSGGTTSMSRAVPTFSLDSGLVFERDASYFGRAFRQTLEPRAFYVYTPFRDQSRLPLYDTAANDFNFATIYTENAFVGNDRIADNNLLTLGLTTRLIDPASGAEAARLGIAQRLRFSDQNVTLPGAPPVSERLSDVMLGGAVNWTRQWSVDSTVQFNPKTNRSIRTTIGTRYSPSDYRVVSAAYRLQRDYSEQLDVGWQWPLNDLWGDRGRDLGPGRGQGGGRWYSVGRINYSMRDKSVVDAIVGIEYDACCWIGRVVLERLQSSNTSSSKRIMFQLEFVGFTRLGSNPLRTLRENIPRYQYLREEITPPSRFSNYD
ncbi:MAG: LPS-assembly protein LptD [Burkholderiaceae bacterium]|nr:LPS-assembly protein LptD [Burkholderiaceae bacterium]